MENIKGTLKILNSDLVFNDVECEFEYDSYSGIKRGIFPDLFNKIAGHLKLNGQKFIFKNDEFVMYLYINQIINFIIHFRTIRFKRNLPDSKTNNLIFFTTETELFNNQKLNVDGENLTLSWYQNFSAIEFEVMSVIDSVLIRKLKGIAIIVLLYVQLIQTHYCKMIGYKYQRLLYIDYTQDNNKPFTYRKAPSFTETHAETFIKKFSNSPYKDYLEKIIYRLISAKNALILEINFVWMIFALEAIESVYNMKKGRSVKTSAKDHIHFNNIVDNILPNNDLIKVYFKNSKYWRSLLWIYRNKYVHFLRNENDLDKEPDKGQEEILSYIFKDNYSVLIKEHKKLFPIAKRIICEIIDLDYEKDFFKIK